MENVLVISYNSAIWVFHQDIFRNNLQYSIYIGCKSEIEIQMTSEEITPDIAIYTANI